MREKKIENPFSIRLLPEKKRLVETQAEFEGMKAVDWIRKAIDEKLARDAPALKPVQDYANDTCLAHLPELLRDPHIRALIREIGTEEV